MPDVSELLAQFARLPRQEVEIFASSGQSGLSAGVRSALKQLSSELRIQGDHRVSVENAVHFHGAHLKLHLGSGSQNKSGWVNIDLRPAADLRLDVRERLPFDDETVAIIYSEHFFEHLEYPVAATRLLQESFRLLEPGGKFSVGVPDAEELLMQYAKGELPTLMQVWSKDENMQWVSPLIWETPMHFVNFFFRQDDEHKYAYDFETLASVLAKAGFVGITRREFLPGLDSEHRRDGTLYVDAYKPG
jgi:predicted SAM-dependent methyltransferase